VTKCYLKQLKNQNISFKHLSQTSCPSFIKYSDEVLAWDFEKKHWNRQYGCNRTRVALTQIKEAFNMLSDTGYVHVLWDAFPWMIGIMWDPCMIWDEGSSEMVSSDGPWPNLQKEFIAAII
jgi:hypothetical protein